MPHFYDLDEAATKFVKMATTVAIETAQPAAADVDARGRVPEESLAVLAAAGLFGLCLPPDVGGKGQGPNVFCAVVEELAQACASTAMIYVMHTAAAQIIAASPTLASKQDLLKQIALGKHLTTLAFSERGSRSEFWAPVSRLEAQGSDYVTSGFKSWVTSASRADSYVSSAQTPGAASPVESVLYLVRKGTAGVTVGPAFNGLGLRGNDSSSVTLENVKVPKADLISELGKGMDLMMGVCLPWFNIGSAAMANGLCRAAIDVTAAHLQNAGFEHRRSQLRELPNLRARIAAMSVRTEQARALLGHTLREMVRPTDRTTLYVLQTRLASVQAAADVTELAMNTCGGVAFSKGLPLERMFRDARAGWVMAPTVDHLEDFSGRALTGMPLF